MRQGRVLLPVNSIRTHPSCEVIDGKGGNNVDIGINIRLYETRYDMSGPNTTPVEHDMTPSGLTTRFVCHVPTDIASTRKGDIVVIVGGLGPDIVFSDADSSLDHGEIKSIPAGSSDSVEHWHIKRADVAQKPSGLYQNEEGIVRKEPKNNC